MQEQVLITKTLDGHYVVFDEVKGKQHTFKEKKKAEELQAELCSEYGICMRCFGSGEIIKETSDDYWPVPCPQCSETLDDNDI